MRCCKFAVDLGNSPVAVVRVFQKLVVAGSTIDFAGFEKFTKTGNTAPVDDVFTGAEVGEAVGGNVRNGRELVVGKSFNEFPKAGWIVLEGGPPGRVFQISLKPDRVFVLGTVGGTEKVLFAELKTDENQSVFRCHFALGIFGRKHTKELVEDSRFSDPVWPEEADTGKRIAGFGMGKRYVAESELAEAGQNDASDPRRVRHGLRR